MKRGKFHSAIYLGVEAQTGMWRILGLAMGIMGRIGDIDVEQMKHLRNMRVSNSQLREVQLRMMKGEIRPDWDPMIDQYEEHISGHSFDPENNENTLKSLKNVNTPLVIRVPATEDLYLAAIRH